MKVKYFPKIYFVCVILILVVSMLVLVSCDDKKTNEKAVEPATAWEEIQEGFDKTAGASGYEVEFKTKSKSTLANTVQKTVLRITFRCMALERTASVRRQ